MRTLWTGSLGFGLVNIPINLYSGVQDHNIDFDMLHKDDLAPVRYAKVCTEEGEELSKDDIVKGYEYEDGQYVVISKQDFIDADVTQTRMLEIMAFTDRETIEPIYFEKFYYLEPAKGGDKAYALLCQALKHSNKAGIIQFVLRERAHIGMVYPYGDMLVLLQMRFSDEIREPESLTIPKPSSAKKELDLALSLIKELSGPFDPEDYHDTYIDALKKLIEDKVKGKKPSTPRADGKSAQQSNVRSLMALLEESVGSSGSSKKKAAAKLKKSKPVESKPKETKSRSNKSTASKKSAPARRRVS